MSPDSANLLRGDTVTTYAWNCPNGGCFFGQRVTSNWTIVGDAVEASAVAEPNGLNGMSQVLLRAAATGEAQITAVASDDSTKRQTVRVVVADSSAITTLLLRTCCSGRDTVVRDGDVIADLRNQHGRRFRGGPSAWSLSDSSLIELNSYPSKFGAGARSFRVKKAGVVEIRARFLDVEGSVLVVVLP